MNFIHNKLGAKHQTKIVMVPSTNEISHIYPLPQPPLSERAFMNTKMRKDNSIPVLTSNPATFEVNDVSVGIINTDVIKDMCINMCIKNPPADQQQQQAANKPKIELVLQSILQQRSFYPLYPGSLVTPIEWEQYKGMMFSKTPDILITPSDLMLFAKNIEGCICINPGTLYKQATAGNYAVITIDPHVVHEEYVAANDNMLFSNRASDRIRVDIHNI